MSVSGYHMDLNACKSIEDMLKELKNSLEDDRDAVKKAAGRIDDASGFGLRSLHAMLKGAYGTIDGYARKAEALRSCLEEARQVTEDCDKDVHGTLEAHKKTSLFGSFLGYGGKILKYGATITGIDMVNSWTKKLGIDLGDISVKLNTLANGIAIAECFWEHVIVNEDGLSLWRSLGAFAVEASVEYFSKKYLYYAAEAGLVAGLVALNLTPVGWVVTPVAIGAAYGLQAGADYGAKHWSGGESTEFSDFVSDAIFKPSDLSPPPLLTGSQSTAVGNTIAGWINLQAGNEAN